jgi:hypothetical protein
MKGKSATKTKPQAPETKDDSGQKCLEEITAALKKYNCTMEVEFQKDNPLGKSVLSYWINIKKNEK